MLDKILNYFKQQKQTRTLDHLASELEIEPSALEGMLNFLVKKGKLKVDYQSSGSSEGCRGTLKGACISCPFKGRNKGAGIKYYYLA